jgi:hypothetical protein
MPVSFQIRELLFPPPTFLQNHICVLKYTVKKYVFIPIISILQRDFEVGKEVLSGTMQESHGRSNE